MQKFATTGPITAVLDVPAGRINVIAADRDDATVEVLPADPAKSRDTKAAETYQVTYTDGTLHIQAAPPRHRVLGTSGSVEVTVQLPTGSRLQATTAGTAIRGVGRLGDVELDSAQATVKLDETNAAQVTVSDGPVTIGRLGGPARISTMNGDIDITEAVAGTVTLTTQKGAITIGAARGVSASLDAGTSYGRISNSLHNTDGPAAALTITATTAYGDITARSL